MATAVTPTVRRQVRDRAQGRCEYCRLPEGFGFMPHEIDHIIAEQHGGQTDPANMAYSCLPCNRRKGPNLTSIDDLTSERAWLFNPRTQNWPEHFQLDADGTITGLTPEGRATAALLGVNTAERVQERAELLALGHLTE